ncbi:unnamed protein product [Meganyctiphanes norvegica]|uniref:Uncharacterized protein n=1 Tax=Meganyctiphanes norvegica TaxID=48144 RepID=A0AAV2PM07_MEGNR
MASYDNPAYTSDGNNASNHGPTGVQKKEAKKVSCCTYAWLVVACLSFLLNFSMLVGGYQAMFDAILKSQLEVKEGSRTYEMWQTTPIPLYLKVTFYNLTNPWEYSQGGKAKMEEVGPLVYREYHQKKNITFNPNATVTFLQERWWIFDEELSNCSESDPLTVLNSVPVSAAYAIRHSWILMEGFNQGIKGMGESLIVNTTTGYLFYGYMDPLLNFTQNLINGDLPLPEVPLPDFLINLIGKYLESHNISIPTLGDLVDLFPPGLIDYDMFGWFYARNHSTSYDGLWNMYTGSDSLDKLGKVDMWQNSNTTNYFPPPCNQLRGSAGEIWNPGQTKTYMEFYSADLCMSAKMYFKEERSDEWGLEMYRYWGDNRTFSNGSTLPENECYCVKGTCAPTGLLNAESCRFGSPAFISYPHFYLADPWAKSNIEGIRDPNPEKDIFYIDLIPEVGVPAHVAARMQINMHVQPYNGNPYCYWGVEGPNGTVPHLTNGTCESTGHDDGMDKCYYTILGIPNIKNGTCDYNNKPKGQDRCLWKSSLHLEPGICDEVYPDGDGTDLTLGKIEMFENVTEGLVPMIWFEELADMPEDLAGQLNMLLFIMKTPTITIIFSVCLAISAIILIGCGVKVYKRKKSYY